MDEEENVDDRHSGCSNHCVCIWGMVHSVYHDSGVGPVVSVFGSKEVGRVAGRDARSGGEPAYGAC